jgi:Zn-dependent peptidase ImmA (M78 family)/transcriptional regulator with XRE-family HTH domain
VSGDAQRVVVTFDPQRLVTARELRGLSQVDAAREVGELTSASISQFENGHVRPSAVTLERLAVSLEVPVSFFATRTPPASTATTTASMGPSDATMHDRAFFRSLRSTAVSDRRRSRALTQLVHLLVQELEPVVELPAYDVPEHDVPVGGDVEQVAAEVRAELGVKPGPIPDVVRILEQHGVVTARFRVSVDKVDAFTIPYRDRPVVVLGADKGHRDRSRFDAAHELAHLVLHRHLEPGDAALERQAHAFGAAFLMPACDIAHRLPAKVDWGVLIDLKREWQVSIAALLMRAKTAGPMSDAEYTKAMKALSARGWRRQEPADLGAPETPKLLSAALKAATDASTTLEELAARGGLPLPVLKTLLGPSINPRPIVRL